MLHLAACHGADPRLFDAIAGDDVDDALSYCDRCPIIPQCEEYVRPKQSYYDGVVAGKVWKNGVSVEPGLFDLRETE
jgi:WhiB family redox-sensing transcriptional regulator